MTKRTPYKRFPGKEAMFDAIVAQAAVPLPPGEATPFDQAAPFAPQLAALLERYMDVVATDAYVTLSRVLVAEFNADPQRSIGVPKRDDAAAGPVEDFIAQAVACGMLRPVDPV